MIRKGVFYLAILFAVLSFSDEAYSQKRKKRKDKEKKQQELLEKSGETEAEFYFIEGMRQFVIEEYDDALKNFKKVIEIKPTLAAAHYKIADIYLVEGNADEALPYAKNALEFDPKNKAYYLLLARVYEFRQDYQKAANTLERLIENVEGVEEHYYDLALIKTYLEDYEGAMETYVKIEEAFGSSPEIMQQRQRLLLRLNRLDEAIELGKKIIAEFPEEEELIYDQVKLLIANDKRTEAREMLTDLLKDDPDSPQARILLSDIFRAEGQMDSANAQLYRAFRNPGLNIESKIAIISGIMRFSIDESQKESLLKLSDILEESHPEDSRAMAFKADIQLNFQMKNEALGSYKKALSLDENSLMIWMNIVLLHFEFEDYDSVTHYADNALEIFPNQGRLWFMSGLGYYSKSDHENAKNKLEMANKYILDDSNMKSDIYSTLGDTYNSLEQFEKSDEAYDEALRINPENEHVLNNYSYFLSLRQEKLELAEEMMEKLMVRFPDNSTYLDTYAWVLYKKGDYKKALEYIEKAVKSTDSGVVVEHHGDILFKLGRVDEAVEAWEKAKELGDASEFIEKKIQDKKLYE